MSGLLNFIQGASNAAASNVSAPVDGLAWLLKKAGVNVGTPVGGSDWMRQQGLTAEAPGLGGLLGESVGGVLPMVAAAKAPQIAAGLLKVGENAAADATITGPSAGQRGMALFNTSGLPNQGRDLIRGSAEKLRDELTARGFSVDLTHSGSAAGPSSYLRVSDPDTGRFLSQQVRLSGHSKGPFEAAGVHDVGSPEEIQRVIDMAEQMRQMGKSGSLMKMEKDAAAHAEKTMSYWQTVYARASEKLASGQPLSNKEKQSVAWMGKNGLLK